VSEAREPEEEPRPAEDGPSEGRAPDEASAHCGSCGEPVDPRQLVCLNCGARVALKEQRSWATEPLAPLAAALVVLIVIGAGLFGFAIAELTSDEGDGAEQAADVVPDDQQASDEPEAEGPAVVSGKGQEGKSSTKSAPEAEARAETAPAEEPATDPNAVPGWPAGVRAHTVVLVTTSDGPAARRVAREARGSGLEAGLIRSEPYNLGTGLWVVFTGRFDTPEGAARQAAGLQERYPGAYPQFVQRSQ
jgi:predicted nucleic acid-binding Zn ribbon protein